MAAEVAEFSDFGDVLEEAGGSARVEELVEIDLPESTTEEVRVVPGTDEFSSLGDLLEEVPENNEIEELTGSEPIEMTSDVSAEAAEEVTEFPDFEDVFGENSEELAGIATENLAVEGMESVDFGNTSDASLEQNESEFVASASELEMDFANVLSEVEDSVQADSAVSIGGTDVEPQHEESAEDLTELAGLFGDVSMDAVQGGDGALSGLNLDAEAENYTSEIHNAADVGGDETNEEDLGLGELFDGLSDADIVAIADSPSERGDGEFSSMDDLENFLGVAENGESSPTLDVLSDYFDSSFGEEGTDAASTTPETGADSGLDNLDDLEGLLTGSLPGETSGLESLDSLLVDAGPTTAPVADDFADLSSLLDSTIGRASVPNRPVAGGDGKKSSQRVTAMKVKVDVTYLDSLNNLVGELVVNRNLLASDSERMQGFIGNLLNQVQQLSEVSQKMRDTFDRSVLETSVIASRPRGFSGFQQMLVVDRDRAGGESNNDPHDIRSRFTGDTFDTYNEYHVLSQEIIELIVKIKESTSDIEFVVSETDQVTRQLGTITTQVQDNLKQLRMLPFSQLTDRLPRGVRDRALQANKKADIAFEGTDTLVDKAILEQLQDPMVHLVNNAIDHGIEDPETRRQRGKPEAGQLTVRAYHQGNQTVITVSDDGGGIDPEKVKQSAIRKGLLTPAEAAKLSDLEAFNLIFRPGFSTAAVADMYKGRGVGMDVVKSSIEEIRGSILTESEVGKGTTFTIRLPLTLSITKAMSCVSNRNKIAFPVDSVEDMLEIPRNQIQLNSKGEPTLPWRDIMLPFLPLSSLLTYNRQISRGSVYGKQDEDILSILVLRNDNNFLALQTDQIIGESEIVIKQLEGPVPQPPGIAGATILGDGRVMAIANVLELFDIASGRLRFKFDVAEPPQELDEQHDPIVLIVDDSITVRELLSVTFSKVGYRVEQARDGLDAWDKLRAGLPCDLIFCDIEMPKMDGLELLSRVKKDETLKKIPMAMLTSRGADRHRQTARELGANGYFTKPYLEEEVITASKRLLKGERLLDSHS
ncbi:MAG TPA: hybrid sensor histidine kinase/response regulator [Cyanobacteria bacterium UBA8156]|nr:hybrid sensor histidine kinase/response regulator [Cyanobacteria bacterium UBA8156]